MPRPGRKNAWKVIAGLCAKHKIEPDDRLIFSAGASIEEGEKAGAQALNESVSMTAIQAANDLVAIGAANVLLNQGVKFRKNFPSRAFGNIVMSEHFRVPLTTVRQPKLRLGVAAMEMMQKLPAWRTRGITAVGHGDYYSIQHRFRPVQILSLNCRKPIQIRFRAFAD